jgi:hypothetical protein
MHATCPNWSTLEMKEKEILKIYDLYEYTYVACHSLHGAGYYLKS